LNGSGKTAQNIITKGSACVEAFRTLSHQVEVFCGLDKRNRRHKEARLGEDIRALVMLLQENKVHCRTLNRPLWKALPKDSKKQTSNKSPEVVDILFLGRAGWTKGKIKEFINETAFSQEHGYPISDRLEDNQNGVEVTLDAEADVMDAEV
jgi:hypothetical protein